MNRNPQCVVIVPPVSADGGPCKVQGSQVRMPDGTPIPFVYRVELIGGVDDVWKARIYCHATVEGMSASGDVIVPRRLSWWRRALLRLAGVRDVRQTHFDSDAHEYRGLRLVRPYIGGASTTAAAAARDQHKRA